MNKPTSVRQLSFRTLQDILSDAESLSPVSARSAGEWSVSENIEHVAKTIQCSRIGFRMNGKVPLIFRILGPLLKTRVIRNRFKAGRQVPASVASAVAPSGKLSIEQSVGFLGKEIASALDTGMNERNPIFGQMSHDEWVMLHCRHAELHFGFIHSSPSRDNSEG